MIYWDVILPIDELIFVKMVKTTNHIVIVMNIYGNIPLIIIICIILSKYH